MINVNPVWGIIRPVIEFIINNPVFVSALAALLSFVFSIYVYRQTRKITRPTQRPIIVMKEQKYDGRLGRLSVVFENAGSHPSDQLCFRMGLCPRSAPIKFYIAREEHYVNQLAPGNHFTVHFPLNTDADLYVYLLLEYKSTLFGKKTYATEYWLISEKNSPMFLDQTIENMSALLPYIDKCIPERKKLLRG